MRVESEHGAFEMPYFGLAYTGLMNTIAPAQKIASAMDGLSAALHRGADCAQHRLHVHEWKWWCDELHQIFRLNSVALPLLVTFQVKYLLLRSNPAVHIFIAHATRH